MTAVLSAAVLMSGVYPAVVSAAEITVTSDLGIGNIADTAPDSEDKADVISESADKGTGVFEAENNAVYESSELGELSTEGSDASEDAESSNEDEEKAADDTDSVGADDAKEDIPDEDKIESEELSTESATEDMFFESETVYLEPEKAMRDASSAGSKPSVVTTVDSRADGITLNLFDYTVPDRWANDPQHRIDEGINTVTALGFFGHGGEPDLVGGTNTYTGQSTARQGTVKRELVDGYPVLYSGDSLKPIFDTTKISGAKKVYEDVNHLFQRTDQDCYVYDSDSNYAYYNPAQGDGGNFKVYDGTYQVGEVNWADPLTPSDTKTNVGFFPFDDYNESKDNLAPTDDLRDQNISGYNHQFGLTMTAKFYMPEDGKVDGEDLIFNFSGDDDAFVFIDGKLVLDIGGLHRPVSGSINFANGTVTVSSEDGSEPTVGTWFDQFGAPIGSKADLSDLLGGALTEGEEHEIAFFYLERGGCYSNMSLVTNIHKAVNKNISIRVRKKWAGSGQKHPGKVTVKLKANDKVIRTAELSADNDWEYIFEDLQKLDENGNEIVYKVIEKAVSGYKASYQVEVEGQGTAEEPDKEEIEREIWVPVDSVSEDGTYAIVANDWYSASVNGKPGINIAVAADAGASNGLNGEKITVETDPITAKEVTGTDETGPENEYNDYLTDVPENQQWNIVNGGGSWTIESKSDSGKYIALAGNTSWFWNNCTHNYWYMLTEKSGWDGAAGINYSNIWRMRDDMIVMGEVWYDYGYPNYGGDQYLYMNNGTKPEATSVEAYAGHYRFYKKITVVQENEVLPEITEPSTVTITNKPVTPPDTPPDTPPSEETPGGSGGDTPPVEETPKEEIETPPENTPETEESIDLEADRVPRNMKMLSLNPERTPRNLKVNEATGDSSMIFLWGTMTAAAAVMLAVYTAVRRRRK